MTALLGSTISIQLSASEYAQQQVDTLFSFISELKTSKNRTSEDLNLARWIDTAYATNPTLENELIEIVNNNKDYLDQKTDIKELWKKDTAPKSEGYFSNISTMAKATAAFMVTAGIISYLYLTRPWIASATK